jgi:arylsulfatase A-like enzyme
MKNPWASELCLAKILSDSGYYTLLTGKWHIGESEGMRPHDVGFDEFYGNLYHLMDDINRRAGLVSGWL